MSMLEQGSEYAKPRGWFGALILRLIWISSLMVVSWYLTQWLLLDSGLLTIEMLYQEGIPRSLSEEWVIYMITAVMFLVVNIFIMIGYVFALPSGRRRSDHPSQYSHKQD
jgi:hypothetical protein